VARADKVIEKLNKDISKLQAQNTQIKDIFPGSITDSYQPIERGLQLARQVVRAPWQKEKRGDAGDFATHLRFKSYRRRHKTIARANRILKNPSLQP